VAGDPDMRIWSCRGWRFQIGLGEWRVVVEKVFVNDESLLYLGDVVRLFLARVTVMTLV